MADLDAVETERSQVADGRKRDKLRAAELEDNLRRVISTPAGRHVVWEILDRAKLFEPLNPESRVLVGLVAIQNEAKHLLKQCLTVDPNFYNIAQGEATDRTKRLGK